MIEALAIFFVATVAAIALLVTRLQVQSRKLDPQAEHERLQQYLATLEDRLLHAEKRNYDEAMKAHFARQLEITRRQLAHLQIQLPR